MLPDTTTSPILYLQADHKMDTNVLSYPHVGALQNAKASRSFIPLPRPTTASQRVLTSFSSNSPRYNHNFASPKVVNSKFSRIALATTIEGEEYAMIPPKEQDANKANCDDPRTPENGDQGRPRTRVPVGEGRGAGVGGRVQGQGAVERHGVRGQNAYQGQRRAQGHSANANILSRGELVNVEPGTASPKTCDDEDVEGSKTSPLDKALPPKPSLRSMHSPERRGVFDATDSAIKLLNESHPALAPERPNQPPLPNQPVRRSTSAMQVSRNGSPMARKSFPPDKPLLSAYSPRSRNGVGPTLRVAKEADEVIMGRMNGKGPAQRVRQLTPGQHRLSQVGIVDSPESPHPPRTSSLPNTPEVVTEETKAPSASVVDRLSRPTKASTRRAAVSKFAILERGQGSLQKKYGAISVAGSPAVPIPRTTSAALPKSTSTSTLKKTGKGFRSAMSAFLPGRRRTEGLKKSKDSGIVEPKADLEKPEVEGEVTKKSNINRLPHASAKSVSFAPATFPTLSPDVPKQATRHTTRSSRNLTTFENSGMNDSTDVHDWKKKPTDKAAPKDSAQERETEAIHVAEATTARNREWARASRTQTNGRRSNDEDDDEDRNPNTPHNTGNPTHYNEDHPSSTQAEPSTPASPDRYNDTVDSVTAFFDHNLRASENNLFRIITQIDAVPNSPLRLQMLNVVAALENSIRVTREARVANIYLHESVAMLVSLTSGLASEAAHIVEGDN